ncbi:hypothetical protein ALT785_690084 [Alteromonas infernus]
MLSPSSNGSIKAPVDVHGDYLSHPDYRQFQSYLQQKYCWCFRS